MDIELRNSKTIGLRTRKTGGAPKQMSNAPWERLTGIFSKCHWGYPPAKTIDGDEGYSQELEDEYTGDGTWIQMATGSDLDADAIHIHALLVEVGNLTRENLLSRLEGIATLGHTLYQHHPNAPSWRLVIPFRKPVAIATADAAYRKFFAEMMPGGVVYNEDKQGRWFLRPGCRDDQREFFDHFKLEGNFVDIEAVLAGTKNWDSSPTTSSAAAASFTPDAITPASAPHSAASTRLASIGDTDLRAELENIYASLTAPEDFPVVSAQLFELEFELNRRGKWAPYFRPSFPIPYHVPAHLSDIYKSIQQARVVIDCHWLHSQLKKFQATKEPKWQALLNPAIPFPLALAQDFAARAIKGAERSDEILCLTPFQQTQLRAMLGKRLNEARKKAEDAKQTGISPLGKTLRAINQWSATDPRLHTTKYVALARAMAMLEGTTHTNTELGALIGLTLGVVPLRENQVRDMKKRLTEAVKRYS